MAEAVEKGKGGQQQGKGKAATDSTPKKEKEWDESGKKERGYSDECVISCEENLNIVCMSNEPPGNKAMLGHVAPNLNLSVSVSALSSPIHLSLIHI